MRKWAPELGHLSDTWEIIYELETIITVPLQCLVYKKQSEFHIGPDKLLEIFITFHIKILSFFHSFIGTHLEGKLNVDIGPT